jgi:hypothetical protein
MRVIRLAGFLTIAGILIWIPLEDETTFWVSAFAIFISIFLGAALLTNRQVLGGWRWVSRGAFIGAVAGLAVVPLAIGLMALKSGIHGHGTPDFSVAQVQRVFGLLPYAVFTGIASGLSVALLTRRD